ncbi:hypothetical protein VTK26DRAFT_9473 [Humicola hyalothermophila]
MPLPYPATPAPAAIETESYEYTSTFDSDDDFESDCSDGTTLISFERKTITPPYTISASGERIEPESLLSLGLKKYGKRKENDNADPTGTSPDNSSPVDGPAAVAIPIPGRGATDDPQNIAGVDYPPPASTKWYDQHTTNTVPLPLLHHAYILAEIARDPLAREDGKGVSFVTGWHNHLNHLADAGPMYDAGAQAAHRSAMRRQTNRDWVCCACRKPVTAWAVKCVRCGRHSKGECCARLEPEPKVDWKKVVEREVREYRRRCRREDEERAKGDGVARWLVRTVMGK